METYKDPELSAQERAQALVELMTLEEKASQLVYGAPAIERLGIPAYNWWNEALHGVARAGTATMFPQAIGLAATFDTDLINRVAKTIATEARAKYNEHKKHGDRDIYKGLTFWSPNINIFRDPRWGRGQETYGECPYLTTRMGIAFVAGLQGDGKYLKVAACAKHFAGHSGPEGIRHSFDARVTPKDLSETYLPAFEALVKEARVEGIMGAYNRLNGEPACASRFLMDKLYEWGFEGYFTSDCWAICDFHLHHMVTATAPESAAMALKAGCDTNCGHAYLNLLIALKEGMITEDDITKAAVHLFRTRMRLGMFDDCNEYDSIDYDVVSCDGHKKLSLECAHKSIVLLKNSGLLPLNKEKIKSVGVIGPDANSIRALIGNYHGTADGYITFLEGIRSEFDGRIYYSEGCHLFKDRLQELSKPGDGYSEAVTVAEKSDVVVLCVGLDETLEGEEGSANESFAAGDKLDLLLPESQRILIEKVLAAGKPTVIVLAAGSSINPLADSADAIIQAWYPGQEGGRALADILFGKISPSGKLPVTFYKTADQLPPFEDYSMENRTYRYAKDNVLYPFGFGLTYSNVICRDLQYDQSDTTARFSVQNIGAYDTEEVLQLYIRDNKSKWAVPNHRLCGFKRIWLKKGETAEVSIPVPQSAFEVVNDAGQKFIDSDTFTLFAGISQPDELSCSFTGIKCVNVEINI